MPDRNRSSTCEIRDEHSGNGTGFTMSISVPPHLAVSFQQCCIFALIYALHLLESKPGKDRETSKKAMIFRMSESIESTSTSFVLKSHPF